MHKPIQRPERSDPFDTLAKSLNAIAQANAIAQVDTLHKAISLPGQSALEVSMAEARRNHADLRARELGPILPAFQMRPSPDLRARELGAQSRLKRGWGAK
jgi:hypothetical protein